MSIDLSYGVPVVPPDLGSTSPILSQIPPDIGLSTPTIYDVGLPPPAPIDLGIPPVNPVDLPPPLAPIDTFPLPPPLPPTPPPDLTGILPPVGLPPIGYDSAGNPIYSVTGTTPVDTFPPVPPGPIINQPPPVTVTQTSSSGTAVATAIASINQSINVVNQDVQPLADAVKNAINQSAQDTAKIQQDTANQISQAINGYSNSLFGWVQDLWNWLKKNIGDILNGIVKAFESIGKVIYDAIKTVGESIASFFQNTIGPILGRIDDAIAHINQFYQQHIDPILRTISQVTTTVQSAIVAIERDINAGIQGLLRLPGDLSNALSSIDAALIRAGQALRVHKASDADYYYVTGDGKGFADHIKSFADAVSGRTPLAEKTTFNPGRLDLSEPTLAQELPALIDAMNTILFDLAKGLANIVKDPVKLVESLGIGGAATLLELAEPQELVRALWDVMKSPFDTIGELAAERVREIAQLSKLDPATLANAWRRNFIDASAMDAEMKVQGYNGIRSEILRRLTTHVEDATTLVDLLYRQIILDDDFVSGLRDLGYTDAQIGALRAASTQLLDINTALTAWRRDDITEDQLNGVFDANRWNLAERELIKGLTYAPPGSATATPAWYNNQWFYHFFNALYTINDVPEEIRVAGKRDGLDEDAILLQWVNGIQTLPATAWLNLYWRGMRTREELKIALRRDRVVTELQDDWIDSQRPLIPFRTIPAMVKAGLISESDALNRLQQHGYSLPDAVLLMEYASRGSKTSKANTAATQHELSLAQAKTAYQDGVITQDQYQALLESHGLDANTASLEIELVNIAEETKDRKQIGVDIVNEYQAGLIDQQGALQQLAASGYTIAEQAQFAKQIKGVGATKVKLPTEAELRAWTKAGLISADEYETRLVTLGYLPMDAHNFRELHYPSG